MEEGHGRFLQGRQRTQIQISEPRSRVKLFTTVLSPVMDYCMCANSTLGDDLLSHEYSTACHFEFLQFRLFNFQSPVFHHGLVSRAVTRGKYSYF